MRTLLFASALMSPQLLYAQQAHGPVFEVYHDRLDQLIGNDLEPNSWTLAPEAQPDSMSVSVEPGKTTRACLLAGDFSFCRNVSLDQTIDFTMRYNGIDHWTQFVGTPPQAIFDEAYRNANSGKITIVAPPAYELINVAIALTRNAKELQCMIQKGRPYNQAIDTYFAGAENHPLVRWLDQRMDEDLINYFRLKMSGHSYRFNDQGQLERNTPYYSTNFRNTPNALKGHEDLLQSFADETQFLRFYHQNETLYRSQVDDFQNQIGVPEMIAWLKREFPSVKPYDHHKVVFSPLVNCMQSATWMESNGFREIQAHMTIPYDHETSKLNDAQQALERGSLVFTEFNHGFINPTEEVFSDRVEAALSNREGWADDDKSASSYPSPSALFNEYMNWGLIDLRYHDLIAAPEDFDALKSRTRKVMVNRGFPRFPEFSDFLIDLYVNRPAGSTLESLYPQIVAWFEDRASTS